MVIGDIYYWRQVLVMSAIWFQGVSVALMLAYPSVLNSHYNDATGVAISEDQASWLASSTGLMGCIGIWFFSAIFEVCGRKFTHLIICLDMLISWIILYFANNVTWLYVARIMQGLNFGIIYINSILISEYSCPVSRGYFSTIMKTFMGIGSLICHCMSVWTWREVAAVAAAVSFIALTLTTFWPESPYFYAEKGRFSECTESFTWLHGSSVEKKKELSELIVAQSDLTTLKLKDRNTKVKIFLKTFTEPNFYKSLFLVFLATFALDSSGRYFVVAYILQVMNELVGSRHAVYYTALVDCSIIVSITMSCFLVRYIKRRTILFSFGSLIVALMYFITLVSHLRNTNVIPDIIWVLPGLVVLHNVLVNLSIIPICYCISGEVFPLEYRGVGTLVSGIMFCFLYAIFTKSTPPMLRDIGLGGTYAVFSSCLAVALVIMYFVVPETKNRTLQDIEDEIKGVRTNTKKLLMKFNESSTIENLRFNTI